MTTDTLTLGGVCPKTAAAFSARADAEKALEEAEAELVAATADLTYWGALRGDPVRCARENKDPGEVHKEFEKAEEAAYSAEVRRNTRKIQLDDARTNLRKCAEGAAAIIGEKSRPKLKKIQATYDRARGEMEQAARDEAALIESVNMELMSVFGYDKPASHLGLTFRPAVG